MSISSITKVESWQTSDGKTFPTEAEALAHEQQIQALGEVESFIAAHPGLQIRGQAARVRNILGAWLAWQAAGKPAAVEPPAPKEVGRRGPQKAKAEQPADLAAAA